MVSRFIPSGSLLAALLLTVAMAGGGAWLQSRWPAPESGTVGTAAYDINVAIELAGTVVPAEIESFYFFPIDPAASDQAPELATVLLRAAAEHDFVGITGTDAQNNLVIVLAALDAASAGALAGAVIVYVGPAEHESRLRPSIARAGAELRLVHYAPSPADAGPI